MVECYETVKNNEVDLNELTQKDTYSTLFEEKSKFEFYV